MERCNYSKLNADYEQKQQQQRKAADIGSTKSLNVNIADITEYPTINIPWYDDILGSL